MSLVLIVASGAAWESPVLGLLSREPGIVVLKRCVDVDDLLAAASAGQADVAVLGVESPGLDEAAVDHLRQHAVRPVAIVPGGAALDAARLRAARIGIRSLVPDDDLAALPAVLAAPYDEEGAVGGGRNNDPRDGTDGAAAAAGDAGLDPPPADGRVLVIWGPRGAPGRTTLAVGVAAELAQRGHRTTLVDADPYGGSVGQQLGILDEVSGLLSSARFPTREDLSERFGSLQRSVGARLSVVTGLPRADRWVELRPGALERLVDVARGHGQVVVDTGFSLEDDPGSGYGSRPGRNQLTLEALDAADEVVVIGNADPVGLARLARGLVELRSRGAVTPVRVVVNRMRPTLGWSEKEITGMVTGFARVSALHFLPEDRGGADRALVAGRTLVESGDSPLTRGIAAVVDALAAELLPGPARPVRRLRRRTARR